MIEISHRQARRTIRAARDQDIPEAQWAVLEAHLEGCPECRAYVAQIAQMERGLSRMLHDRWSGIDNRAPTPAQVLDHRRRRAARLGWLKEGAVWALIVLALAGYTAYHYLTTRTAAPPPQPSQVAASTTGVRTPTAPGPVGPQFQDVFAFVLSEDGESDIYLANPGAAGLEVANLTHSPGQDTDPVWSPDGAWIAFLSDRSGKREVYVINVAGSRLTQLTDHPQVDWRGPLSWSHDGRWLALTGRPAAAQTETGDSSSWVYLVPVNGDGPRTIGGTRGAAGPLGFSPAAPLLAYGAPEGGGSLRVYHLNEARFISVGWTDNQNHWLHSGGQGGFDWSADGLALAYLADGPYLPNTYHLADASSPVTQLKRSGPITSVISSFYGAAENTLLEETAGAGSLRGLAWSPDPSKPRLAYLADSDGDNCWTVVVREVDTAFATRLEQPALCVDGPLARASWSPDGRWLVVNGHQPGSAPGIYALAVPYALGTPAQARFERLVEPSAVSGPAGSLPSPVIVRPAAPQLKMTVKAYARAADPPPPAAGLPGEVFYSLTDGDESRIFRSPAASSGLTPLTTLDADSRCPALAPGGGRMALLSDWGSDTRYLGQVFLTGPGGFNDPGQVSRLTQPQDAFPISQNDQGIVFPSFDCPVWSPDGTRLAALLHTENEIYLTLISTQPGLPPVFYNGEVSAQVQPQWTVDGNGVLYLENAFGGLTSRLKLLRITKNDPPQSVPLEIGLRGQEFLAAAFAPDGQSLAYLTADEASPGDLRLFVTQADGTGKRLAAQFQGVDRRYWLAAPHLAWLRGGRLALVLPGRVDAINKAALYLINPDLSPTSMGASTPVFRFEDLVLQTIWSADGRWLVYRGEGGLYGLDVIAASAGQAGPAYLVNGRVTGFDWQAGE